MFLWYHKNMTSHSPSSDQSKTWRITKAIRQQLVNGDIEPGQKLPTYDQLEEEYQVSRATLRQVINTLKQEGLVHTAGRSGMFAAQNPSYMNRYGIVFPSVEHAIPRFWSTINLSVIELQMEHPVQFSVYQNVNGQTGTMAYRQLMEDMQNQKLAGLFLISAEDFVDHSPELLSEKTTPKLAVCHVPFGENVHDLQLDMGNWHRRAMRYLSEQGCKRIGLLKHRGVECVDFARARAHELGLELRDEDVMTIDCHQPQPAQQMIRLLMKQSAKDRPDGLVIADDNFMEHVCAGLVEADVKVGKDVHVVAHCNWPWPSPRMLPIQRLGFHANHMFYFGIRAINQMRQGKKASRKYLNIPALFEDEAVPETLELLTV
jgi:DNA-binding LacI/PurR family transcriptional regulator